MREIILNNYQPNYTLNENGVLTNVKTNRVRKYKCDQFGYKVYNLKNTEGKRVIAFQHKLIAEAFIPNPLNLPQVNHINGNKQDNRIENLEWVSRSGNVNHYTQLITKLKKEKAELEQEIINLKKQKQMLETTCNYYNH